MKKRALLLVLALALVMACAMFTVSAANTTPASIDLTTLKCPCSKCNGKPYTGTWYTYDDIVGGKNMANPNNGDHFYLDKSLTPGSQISVSAGEEVVYVIDNASIIVGGATTDGISGRALLVNGKGAKMHLIGNNATYTVKSTSTNNGIVQVSTSGELHMYGDLELNRRSIGTNASTDGGLVKISTGLFHIHDCDGMGLPTNDDPILTAPLLANTTSSKGGIISLESSSSSRFIMDAGTLNGTTKAYVGGVISAPTGTATINGGTINASKTAGAVVSGGAIYVGGGTVNFNAGTINGGAAANGGAIFVESGTLTIGNNANYTAGATVNGGTATRTDGSGGMGGAIYQSGGTITLGSSGTICGGSAYRGGCLNIASESVFNMNGGTVSGGTSTNQGGQVFLGGTFNMSGGTVTGNSKSTSNARCFRIQDGKLNLSGTATVVSGGTALGDALDVVSVGGVGEVTLDGAATVKNASGNTNGNNIINIQNYNKKTAKLTVYKTWTGTARVNFEYLFSSKYQEADYTVGMTIDTDAAVSTGDYTGTLLMESAPNQPPLYAGNGGTLQGAAVQLCSYDLPKLNAQWFKSGTEAAAAFEDGNYISIYKAGDMDIGNKDVLVDFNGLDCTVTGTGKLYIMDAAGDGYEGTLARITYNNVAATALNPYNDNQYIALANDDGTYSAHRVDLRISAVSVRPSTAGLYYTATLDCDDTLKAAFQKAGIAVSTKFVPGADYESCSLYTVVSELNNGKLTGVLINEILKADADNAARAKTAVYANAYATFTVEGQSVTVLADPYNGGKVKEAFLPGHRYTAYSLNDVMNAIDLRWRSLEAEAQTSVLENLYTPYQDVQWDVQYMTGSVKDLKVLTIGNSLSVDAGHMLGYIAKLEGMENIRFSTLYYGGCTLRQHVSFLTANSPEYRWYDTNITDLQNAAVADTVPEVSMKKADQITLYEGLVMDDWDIIIMQQGVFESGKPEAHEADLQTLIDYVRKHAKNPNAVIMWNMIWAPPVEQEMMDKSNNGIPPDASGFETSYKNITGFDTVKDNKEAQNKMFELIRNAVQTKVCTNEAFLDVIPAGTAQQNALWSGLSDADLYRDYIHASDLARYIYSYMWYCKLTDSDFEGVSSEKVPLAVRYIKKDDISEIPPATEDLDLTADNNYLLNIVNFAITSALDDPFTPHSMCEN